MAKQPSGLRHRFAVAMLHLYPRAWRERYEAEQAALLADGPISWSKVVDLCRGAMREWIDPAFLSSFDDRLMWTRLWRWVRSIAVAAVQGCLTSVLVALTSVLLLGWVFSFPHPEAPGLGFIWGEFSLASGLWLNFALKPIFLFSYALAFTGPVAIALLAVRAGNRWPLFSRLLWLTAFLWFDVWLFGFDLDPLIGAAAGGWVLARKVFPRHSVLAAPTLVSAIR
jgi:hypothetical protein